MKPDSKRPEGSVSVVLSVLVALVLVGVLGFWLGRHGKGTPSCSAPASDTGKGDGAAWLHPQDEAKPMGPVTVEPGSATGAVSASAEAPATAETVPAGGEAAKAAEPASPAEAQPPTATSAVAAASGGTAPAASAGELLAQAESLLSGGKRLEARDAFLAVLDAGPDEKTRGIAEEKAGTLNVELVRQPWPMPEKVDYVVEAGDSIRSIAQKHGTTVELVVESSRLARPDHIEPGDRLRVFSGRLSIVVSKARNDLLVLSNGKFFKRYRIGTGKYGKTPVGTFAVSERIKDPPWWRGDGKVVPFGDKENILGTRWMALKATGTTPEIKGYGIHGTWDRDTIGKAESAGCIRLSNEDVEELFLLVPTGTAVTIEE